MVMHSAHGDISRGDRKKANKWRANFSFFVSTVFTIGALLLNLQLSHELIAQQNATPVQQYFYDLLSWLLTWEGSEKNQTSQTNSSTFASEVGLLLSVLFVRDFVE